jgi:hypothetical protein
VAVLPKPRVPVPQPPRPLLNPQKATPRQMMTFHFNRDASNHLIRLKHQILIHQ